MRQPVGELRKSQAIHTFGIGCSIDLPHFTAIMHGLDDWVQRDWDPTSPANGRTRYCLSRYMAQYVQ